MTRRQPRIRAPVGPVHVPVEDPDAPGCCLTCHRPMDASTDRHITPDQLPASPDRAAELRRTGERED